MKHELLPTSGNFYKANMHMHTNLSDGKMTLEETKKLYMDNGYSIVAFTDHETLVPHNDLSDENFLAITSYEIENNNLFPGGYSYQKTYHLNLYAKDKNATVSSVFSPDHIWLDHARLLPSEDCAKINYPRHYSIASVNDVIRRANEEGFLVCLNHPVWSSQNLEDYKGITGLWGIEVYNHGAAVGGYIDTPQPMVEFCRAGERVFPIAADDAHSVAHCCGGWINVKAEKLEYETVMTALEKGDFYASNGPEIKELYMEDNVVHVSCSEAVSIFLVSERRFTRAKRGTYDAPVTEAAFDITKYLDETRRASAHSFRPFFRIEIHDAHGKVAYSRPYFIDELNG